MAWMTTRERQKLFFGYFELHPAVSLDEYAQRFPKHRHYVRGIVRGTHYALETLPLAYDLVKNKRYDWASDIEAANNVSNNPWTRIGAIERLSIVCAWKCEINRLMQSPGFGRVHPI